MAKRALGRGIGAILEDVEEAYRQGVSDSSEYIKEIEISKILPNPFQPRTHFDQNALKELSESISRHGLLQPIVVVEKDDDYMLIAGERRLRASKIAGFDTIKAIVADIESKNLRELALIENIQRENLNPIELASAYKELINEYKITQEELSDIIHKSRTQITNTIRLLSLSERTKAYISESKISQGHAKILVGLSDKEQKLIVDTIIGQKLSVRETEKLVKRLKEPKNENLSKPDEFTSLKEIVAQFSKAGFKAVAKKNSLVVKFKDENEIENFLSLIEGRLETL